MAGMSRSLPGDARLIFPPPLKYDPVQSRAHLEEGGCFNIAASLLDVVLGVLRSDWLGTDTWKKSRNYGLHSANLEYVLDVGLRKSILNAFAHLRWLPGWARDDAYESRREEEQNFKEGRRKSIKEGGIGERSLDLEWGSSSGTLAGAAEMSASEAAGDRGAESSVIKKSSSKGTKKGFVEIGPSGFSDLPGHSALPGEGIPLSDAELLERELSVRRAQMVRFPSVHKLFAEQPNTGIFDWNRRVSLTYRPDMGILPLVFRPVVSVLAFASRIRRQRRFRKCVLRGLVRPSRSDGEPPGRDSGDETAAARGTGSPLYAPGGSPAGSPLYAPGGSPPVPANDTDLGDSDAVPARTTRFVEPIGPVGFEMHDLAVLQPHLEKLEVLDQEGLIEARWLDFQGSCGGGVGGGSGDGGGGQQVVLEQAGDGGGGPDAGPDAGGGVGIGNPLLRRTVRRCCSLLDEGVLVLDVFRQHKEAVAEKLRADVRRVWGMKFPDALGLEDGGVGGEGESEGEISGLEVELPQFRRMLHSTALDKLPEMLVAQHHAHVDGGRAVYHHHDNDLSRWNATAASALEHFLDPVALFKNTTARLRTIVPAEESRILPAGGYDDDNDTQNMLLKQNNGGLLPTFAALYLILTLRFHPLLGGFPTFSHLFEFFLRIANNLSTPSKVCPTPSDPTPYPVCDLVCPSLNRGPLSVRIRESYYTGIQDYLMWRGGRGLL